MIAPILCRFLEKQNRIVLAKILKPFVFYQTSFISSASSINVFDRNAKVIQRNRAAKLEEQWIYNYVKDEVAYRLADRLLDIKRVFNVAVDLGCGSGHLSKFINPDSIKKLYQCEHAAELLKLAEPCLEIETVNMVVDEEHLPFEPKSLDLVMSCLNLHWVNDIPSTFKQVLTSLRPDGCFLGVVFTKDTLFELRVALQLAEVERLGGFAAHVSPFLEGAQLADLLQTAGFNLISLDVDSMVVNYPDMFSLLTDLQGMGESGAAWNRPLSLNRDALLAAGAIYDEMFGRDMTSTEIEEAGLDAETLADNGKRCVSATYNLLFFIGWRPDPSQAKPLPPGSAKFSIKDVGKISQLERDYAKHTNEQKTPDSSVSTLFSSNDKSK